MAFNLFDIDQRVKQYERRQDRITVNFIFPHFEKILAKKETNIGHKVNLKLRRLLIQNIPQDQQKEYESSRLR